MVFLIFLLVPGAHAQEPNPSDQPDVVQEKFREEVRGLEKKPEKPAPIELPPEPKPPPVPEGPSFQVTKISFKGNTILSTEKLDAIVAERLPRKEVTLTELQEVAQAVQQEYRRRGYITTVAFLPPQRIEGGRVLVEILEGRVGKITVEGAKYAPKGRLASRLRLSAGDILYYPSIRNGVRQLNMNPDRRVQALLRPGVSPGTTDIVLRVEEDFPIHPGFFVDQRGTDPIGLQRAGGTFRHTSLLGWDDSLVMGILGGQFFGAVYGQYSIPFGPFATRLILSATHAQVSPKRHFRPFGVNGTSDVYSVAFSQPLLLEKEKQLSVRVGLDFMEAHTMVLGATSRRDELRVVRLQNESRFTDRQGVWTLEPQLSFGIDGLRSSHKDNPVAGRIGSKPDFTKFRMKVARVQRMPLSTQAVVQVNGQLAGTKLSPQEELYLGGATSVRGYPEGDYLADSGFYSQFDYILPLTWLPAGWKAPLFDQPLKNSMQFILFADRGYGKLRGRTGNERSSRNMTGIGVGLGFQAEQFLARIEWGFHVGEKPLNDDSPNRIHFRIQNEF